MTGTVAPKAAKKSPVRKDSSPAVQEPTGTAERADTFEPVPALAHPDSYDEYMQRERARWEFALEILGARVAALIEAERATDDVPDSKRGRLFPPQLIAREALSPGRPPAEGIIPWEYLPDRLVALQDDLPLDDLDLALILIAVAIALDPRFEHFYIVLNNDTEARGPMVSTALRLAGISPLDAYARSRLRKDAPLQSLSFLTLGPASRTLLSQVTTVPERLIAHLLGSNTPDPVALPLLIDIDEDPLPADALASVPELDEFPAVYRARAGSGGRQLVIRQTVDALGYPPALIDGRMLTVANDVWREQLRSCLREAALGSTLLAVDTRGCDADLPVTDILDELESTGFPSAVLVDNRRQLGAWERRATTLPLPSIAQRRLWWNTLAPEAEATLAETTTHLDPEDIAAFAESGAAMNRHRNATKPRRSKIQVITPAITFNDVILGERPAQQLRELRDRLRYRSVVLDEWGMRPGGGRGRGVTALFAGPSGTGKTMSAEALAGELGVPLFLVDLASVIDKYIGETEKNLEQIFMAVENDDGVLLFDEADALFGKRSEVSDARDRYANVEVAYLLQRIESFDGLAILTTNLRANLDEAFQRRLDMVIDFPEPDDQARREIWRAALGRFGDCLTESDRAALATLDIAGGSIRSAVVTAAYLAAAEDSSISRWHVMRGLHEEWRKMGRLNFPHETFRGWESLT